MLVYQGWFTALYTQHLHDSQSFEFEICILQALNISLIRCTNGIFPREAIPSHYFPFRVNSSRVLAWGLNGVKQPRSSSCHYPTAATKCNEQPSRATAKPAGGKACSSTKGGYSTLTRFSKFRL